MYARVGTRCEKNIGSPSSIKYSAEIPELRHLQETAEVLAEQLRKENDGSATPFRLKSTHQASPARRVATPTTLFYQKSPSPSVHKAELFTKRSYFNAV